MRFPSEGRSLRISCESRNPFMSGRSRSRMIMPYSLWRTFSIASWLLAAVSMT